MNEVIKGNNSNNICNNYDTSNWKDRYNDIPDKNREFSYEDYREFYVLQASDGRYLHNCILNESNNNTQKLDKKFITSVMGRRYAHLQQVKYVMEYFINKTSNDKYIESVLDDRISKLEKSIEPEELEKSYKEKYDCKEEAYFKKPSFEGYCDSKTKYNRTEIQLYEEVKKQGISVQKDRDTLSELYDLIDKLLKILLCCPNKIPDLQLSDKSVDRNL